MTQAVLLVVAWLHAGAIQVDHYKLPSEAACQQAAKAWLDADLTTDPVQRGQSGTPRWSVCVTLPAIGADA